MHSILDRGIFMQKSQLRTATRSRRTTVAALAAVLLRAALDAQDSPPPLKPRVSQAWIDVHRHVAAVALDRSAWMPWNYTQALVAAEAGHAAN